MSYDADHWARQGALTMARSIELERRRGEVESVKVVTPFELLPPMTFFDPDSGRRQLAPDAALIHVGRYLRRSRAYAGLSQARLARRANVSQSMVSRLERGLAPAMGFERVVDIGIVLGRLFPLGVCPHDHRCGWQPIQPQGPPDHATGFIEFLLAQAGET